MDNFDLANSIKNFVTNLLENTIVWPEDTLHYNTSVWSWQYSPYHRHGRSHQWREACRLSHLSRHKGRWHLRRRRLALHENHFSCHYQVPSTILRWRRRRRLTVPRWRNHGCLRLELVHAFSRKTELISAFLAVYGTKSALSYGGHFASRSVQNLAVILSRQP